MRRRRGVLLVSGLIGALAAAPPLGASSHREAPLISQDPTADNTDVYLFRDPIDPSRVDIVVNYVPLQAPASGPNFWRFADEVRYDIHVDNDGDVDDDIVFRLRFRTTIGNGGTFPMLGRFPYQATPISGTAQAPTNP